MPALITHDFFGRDMSERNLRIAGPTRDEMDAFLLGNQGPDPLFYLAAVPFLSKYAQLGVACHAERTPELLMAFKSAVRALGPQDQKIGRAYFHGFLCHFALDSTMHPFVYAQQYALCDAGVDGLAREDGREVHAVIESSFDELVLYVKADETVATFQPWARILLASNEVLAAVSSLYVRVAKEMWDTDIPADLFSRAVKSYRRVQRLLYSPYGGKRAAFSRVERIARRHSFLGAMSHRAVEETTSPFDNHAHRVWKDPETGVASTTGFWELHQLAQTSAARLIQAFDRDELSLEEACALTGDVNFSGVPIVKC